MRPNDNGDNNKIESDSDLEISTSWEKSSGTPSHFSAPNKDDTASLTGKKSSETDQTNPDANEKTDWLFFQ